MYFEKACFHKLFLWGHKVVAPADIILAPEVPLTSQWSLKKGQLLNKTNKTQCVKIIFISEYFLSFLKYTMCLNKEHFSQYISRCLMRLTLMCALVNQELCLDVGYIYIRLLCVNCCPYMAPDLGKSYIYHLLIFLTSSAQHSVNQSQSYSVINYSMWLICSNNPPCLEYSSASWWTRSVTQPP